MPSSFHQLFKYIAHSYFEFQVALKLSLHFLAPMFCSNFKAPNRFAEQKKLVNSDLVLSEFDEDTTDSSLGLRGIAVGGRTWWCRFTVVWWKEGCEQVGW